MRVAIWKTGHEIADTVADSVYAGFDLPVDGNREYGKGLCRTYCGANDFVDDINWGDLHIGYGILREMDWVIRECEKENKPFFHLDRGYFNPGHYSGYYRISYRGTQAKWHEGIPRKPGEFNLEPIRNDDVSKTILICPPTDPVIDFYGIERIDKPLGNIWMAQAMASYWGIGGFALIRDKGNQEPIDWESIRAVITFNSSVGWEALRRGIPVLSDPNHSIIGTFYKETDLNKLIDNFHSMPDDRLQLFEALNAHQFTLDEIRRGKAWSLIEHYLSSSDGTVENPPALMSLPTQ